MLKYTGGGYNGSRPEIPVRDLTDEEAEEFGGIEYIISTGLYEKVEEKRPKRKHEVKYDEN